MNNKITSEERERIKNEIKAEIAADNCFSGMELASIFGTDYDLDSTCWQYLLELIKSAPVPADRNMKATELADKLKKFRSGSLYYTIEDALGLSHDNSAIDDCIALEKAIRNLDAPEYEWPLDSEGVQIKPYDTVFFKGAEHTVDYIAVLDVGTLVRFVGSDKFYSPELLSHSRPRTLFDIIRDIHASNDDKVKTDLVREAYDLGRADKNE